MAIKHTVNYHPRPSEFTSKIYFYLIVLWTPKRFISSEYFFIFFLKPGYPTMVTKKFQIHGIKMENTFVSKESVYSCPQAQLCPRVPLSLLQAEGNYPSPFKKVF